MLQLRDPENPTDREPRVLRRRHQQTEAVALNPGGWRNNRAGLIT